MNKKMLVIASILVLLVTIVVAQSFLIEDHDLVIKDNRKLNATVDVMGICEGQIARQECTNISGPSTGCKDIIHKYTHSCIKGQQVVEKSEEFVLEDLSYLSLTFNGKNVDIPYGEERFACTYSTDQIVCDSREDGNGDGVCKEGESCAIFDIQQDKVVLTYYNSRHDLTCKDTTVKDIPFQICTDSSVTSTNLLEVLK